MAVPTTLIISKDDSDYNDTPYSELINIRHLDGHSQLGLITVYYEGDKSGRGDKWIQKNSLFYKGKKGSNLFTYIGQVCYVKMDEPRTEEHPAQYQLVIDPNPVFNGIKYNTQLERMDEYTGSGCIKKAALHRMGFQLDASRRGANPQSGLNAIMPLPLRE